MPRLTFGYSTLANRLRNIVLPDLKSHQDWDVLITVQSGTADEPTSNQLSDGPSGERVRTLGFAGTGVTKLRNQVLTNASGKFLVFGDDDVTFNEKGLQDAIVQLETTGAALLLGQAVDEKGKLRKSYPLKAHKLHKLNSAKAATYEMVINLEQVRAVGVFFDEEFGAGAPEKYLGDEYIFICDLLDAGLSCEYAPIVLATHPTDSSGSGWGTERDRRARALIFDRAFKGSRTLPYLARIGFGLRKLGTELTFKTFMKFVFKL